MTTAKSPQRGFSRDEFKNRCTLVQQNMAEANIDVLWLTTEADVRYLSGFSTQFWQSPTRAWHLLLAQTGNPVAVIPEIGLACMERTWIEDIRTWSSPHPVDDGVSLMIDTIIKLSGKAPRVGIPMASGTHIRCCWHDFERIRSGLAQAEWADASDAIGKVRQIKSSTEIEKISYACELTSKAFAQVPTLVEEGMSDIDAFRAFRICCLQQGVDDPAYVVGKVDAGGYDDIIAGPVGHIIASGDVLIFDTGCVFDGYYSDFDRNFAFSYACQKTQSAHQRVWDATEAGLAMARPGVSCAELFQTMMQVMDDDSSDTRSTVGRLGHGLGSQLTETPSITSFDQTELKAGMVITLEPGYCYSPGKIMVHEENLLITESGFQLLSHRAPRDIPVI
ncbi:MAG: Xaa-Pro peptidase family protein [Granulosicoccus sp.]|nr:Xaa-Pro peptidase family protein [Granulosicoccus sp.]